MLTLRGCPCIEIAGDPITILHVIGLPGAGKTTLTTEMGSHLGWPVTSISEHRRGQPPTFSGEMDAWLSLYSTLSERGWSQTIVETSGLNARACLLEPRLGIGRLATVKLTCQTELLHERVRSRQAARGADDDASWAFEASIPDRHAFIDRFEDRFDKLPAAIEVDTTERPPAKVRERVLEELSRLGIGCGG